ncbi:hypothetical protein [Legionella longbeachae]|uniref:hypothetical protein n=1 Tax=Legionella longbeachae TaxID=450 RepID=UPI0012441818|nr:hypothetical protein [Legionella longbeachae]QEY53140.1 hypothetical protein FQU71_18975 [Legionella longbeachae]
MPKNVLVENGKKPGKIKLREYATQLETLATNWDEIKRKATFTMHCKKTCADLKEKLVVQRNSFDDKTQNKKIEEDIKISSTRNTR